jgi:putative transposase
VVHRLLSLQKIAPQRSVGPSLQGLALRREA